MDLIVKYTNNNGMQIFFAIFNQILYNQTTASCHTFLNEKRKIV